MPAPRYVRLEELWLDTRTNTLKRRDGATFRSVGLADAGSGDVDERSTARLTWSADTLDVIGGDFSRAWVWYYASVGLVDDTTLWAFAVAPSAGLSAAFVGNKLTLASASAPGTLHVTATRSGFPVLHAFVIVSLDGVGPAPGSTVVEEHRYKRLPQAPQTPTLSDPSDWTLELPSGTLPLWHTQCTRWLSGAQASVWALPDAEPSARTVTVYVRSSTTPAAPSGAEHYGWSVDVPTGAATLWQSQADIVTYGDGSVDGVVTPSDTLYPDDDFMPWDVAWSTPARVDERTLEHGYLGRFQDAHPLAIEGDWWTLYGESDAPVQRGVYTMRQGAFVRLSGDSSAQAGMFSTALVDVAWAVAQGYGVLVNYGDITYIANLFAQNIVASGQIVSSQVTDSSSGIPYGDKQKPLIELDMKNAILTMRDPVTNPSNFRKAIIGPAYGLKATGYDSSGLNARTLHDLPNGGVSSDFNYVGHLYAIDRRASLHNFNLYTIDAATSATLDSGVLNIDISSYLPSGISNVTAIMVDVALVLTMLNTKVAAGSFFTGAISGGILSGGATNRVLIGFDRQNFNVSANAEASVSTQSIVDVDYVSGVPYVHLRAAAQFTGMNSAVGTYSCYGDVYVRGFYA